MGKRLRTIRSWFSSAPRATGAGPLEGEFTGTFVEQAPGQPAATGSATVIVSPAPRTAYDLRITRLVVGGSPIELFGARTEDDMAATLTAARSAPFDIVRGRASVDDDGALVVDLEGVPFGSYVFTGQRTKRR